MQQHNTDDDELLTPDEAAEFLRTKPGTLGAWRHRKIGPPFVQVSERMPRYRRSDLAAYLEAHTVQPAKGGE